MPISLFHFVNEEEWLYSFTPIHQKLAPIISFVLTFINQGKKKRNDKGTLFSIEIWEKDGDNIKIN